MEMPAELLHPDVPKAVHTQLFKIALVSFIQVLLLASMFSIPVNATSIHQSLKPETLESSLPPSSLTSQQDLSIPVP